MVEMVEVEQLEDLVVLDLVEGVEVDIQMILSTLLLLV
jgi:hypothetical protein